MWRGLPRKRRARSAERQPGFWVLAADTIVVLEGRVFGKPTNVDHARQMLTALSGRSHHVMTAFVLLDPRRQNDRGRACHQPSHL